MKCIPTFKLNSWPILATINGKIAPPTIPVKRIPVKTEWFLGTEFNPSDIITDQTPEIEKPSSLNDKTEISESPWMARNAIIEEDKE